MISKDEVVLNLNNTFFVLGVVLLDQQQQLRLNSSLVVVLLLIFDEFHSNQWLGFVVVALEDLSKCAFSDLFDDLETEANLVVLWNAIITVTVIIAVIHNSLCFSWMNFEFIRSQVVYFFEFLNLSHLWLSQKLSTILYRLSRGQWIFDTSVANLAYFLNSELFSFGSFRDNLALLLYDCTSFWARGWSTVLLLTGLVLILLLTRRRCLLNRLLNLLLLELLLWDCPVNCLIRICQSEVPSPLTPRAGSGYTLLNHLILWVIRSDVVLRNTSMHYLLRQSILLPF